MRSHLFLIISTFIFIKFVSSQNQNYFYEPKEALELINKTTYNSETLQFIVDRLSKTFQDAYAFNEISKNPPKTKFSEDYFKKVDIQKKLKEINTNNTSVYKFYQDLKRTLADLEDLHIQFDISRFVSLYTQIYLILPLHFYIKMYNNKPRIFGKPYLSQLSQDLMSKFKDYERVSKVIEENSNVPIFTINGKDPFNYITTFGNEYLRLKSPYATFVYKFLGVNNTNDTLGLIAYINGQSLANTVIFEENKKYEIEYDCHHCYISINNNVIYENQNRGYSNRGYNAKIPLMACSRDGYIGNGSEYYSCAKCFYAEFYGNNYELKHKFIPCLDNENRPCFYDTVTRHPFYNEGTGDDFIAGPEV